MGGEELMELLRLKNKEIARLAMISGKVLRENKRLRDCLKILRAGAPLASFLHLKMAIDSILDGYEPTEKETLSWTSK